MAPTHTLSIVLISICLFYLIATHALRNPQICDRHRVRGHCQYRTACLCDHRLRFGRRFSSLYYYNRRINRCQRYGEVFNCNAFNSRLLCEATCAVPDAAR
uniref:Pancreatic trypsin inhibitor n=1 Tax=Rhipicephalus appendiculatus TaxID=34631 RepID=A0A131YTG1_RHIAP